MNGLYLLERNAMVLDLDCYIEKMFEHYGFIESDKYTKDHYKQDISYDIYLMSLEKRGLL